MCKPFQIAKSFVLIILPVIIMTVEGAELQGQNSVFLKEQVPKEKAYSAEEVIDSVYGIQLYEELNFRLGGDSVRKCGNYACRAWIEDKYDNGEVLHKGYYVDGQLKIYKNFYPDGTIEREFKITSKLKSKLVKYFPNGETKSEVLYYGEAPMEWTDYYPNGQLKYHEEYDDGRNYHLERKAFQKDGTPEEEFELVDDDEMLFVEKEYHENGEMKLRGEWTYNEDIFDLRKHGEWKHFDENGELLRIEVYEEGEMVEEREG